MQQVDAFQLVAGQNPDADIKSHKATMTWNRSWTAQTVTDFSVGFDRLRTLLVPEENAVGPFVSVSGLQGLGPVGSIPIDRALNRFRYAGRVSHFRGSHNGTAGFEVLRRQLNGIESDVHRGFLSFGNNFGNDAITNLRLGLPTQSIVSIGDASSICGRTASIRTSVWTTNGSVYWLLSAPWPTAASNCWRCITAFAKASCPGRSCSKT